MKSFIQRSVSPLRCRKSVQEQIDEISEKEKALLKAIARQPVRGVEIEKVGDGNDKIAVWDPPAIGSVRGRSLNRLRRSQSLASPSKQRDPSIGRRIDRSSTLLTRNTAKNVTQQEELNENMKENPAPSRSRSINRMFRSRSLVRSNEERDASLEPRIERTSSLLSWNNANNGTQRDKGENELRDHKSDQSTTRRRRSFKKLFRSRSRENIERVSSLKRERSIGEITIKLKDEDLKDVHSALREMEKQVLLAENKGHHVSRASVLDALRSVVETLNHTPETQEYRISVESTVDSDTESVGEETTGSQSRYTYDSYASDGNSRFLADYTVGSNDDASSFFTEYTEGNVTRGTVGGSSSTSADDDSEESESTCDDAFSDDDTTFAGSISSGFSTTDGFRIGQTNFTIKPPLLADVFPTWSTKTDTAPVITNFHDEEQPSMFQQIARASTFGAKAETQSATQAESTLSVDANMKNPPEKEQKEVTATAVETSPSFSSFASSDIFSAERFRSLSPFSSTPQPQSTLSETTPDACNNIGMTSWLKMNDNDLTRLWDDLLWRSAPPKMEGPKMVTPPRLTTSIPSPNGSKEPIRESIPFKEKRIVPTKERRDSWLEATPTECSYSPSIGNSPERASIPERPSIEISRRSTNRQPKSWFRRIKSPEPRVARVVVCSYADTCSPLESPFANNKEELQPSASEYISAVTHRYLFDDDDVDP